MSRSGPNLTPPRDDPLDEPPPYTPRPDPTQGETTIEYGPSRPFQPPPQVAPSVPQSNSLPQPTGNSRRGRSLWQQLTDQIERIADELDHRGNNAGSRENATHHRTGSSWSSYPGQSSTAAPPPRPTQSRNVPPLPPRNRATSSTSLPETRSDFASDFYAAGTGEGLFPEAAGNQGSSTSNEMSRSTQNITTSHQQAPPHEDRSPTTIPTPGRPLLNSGKLLVYPKGHNCYKCSNSGYKNYDPTRPCKKCWGKYGKPFSGPLAYSYSSSNHSSNTQNTNLQRPLPLNPVPRSSAPPRSSVPPPPPPPPPPQPTTYSGMHPVPPAPVQTYYQGPGITTTFGPAWPSPGTSIYQAGDARIGGNLCWTCHGKGTMNIFIDIINCPVCGGCGRTFTPVM